MSGSLTGYFVNLWDEDSTASDPDSFSACTLGRGPWDLVRLSLLCPTSYDYRMVVKAGKGQSWWQERACVGKSRGWAGGACSTFDHCFLPHRHVCGCVPAAVIDSPGSWGRCLVTFSESKEDLKTQSPLKPVLQKGKMKPQEPRLSLPATLEQR